LALALPTGLPAQADQTESGIIWTVDDVSQWREYTGEMADTDIRASENVGERFDLMGDGALLLGKTDSEKRFHQSNYFMEEGHWISKWFDFECDVTLQSLSADLLTYGEEFDLTDWILFEQNPVASEYSYEYKKTETALLPPQPTGQPQDQSVMLGSGRFEGKWLLLFNIGSYALNGWGGMVADSLEPLKKGINPFALISDPYPMHGPGEYNAPNDWIEVEGVYYAAATTEGPASIWTSENLAEWTHVGPLYNFVGSDPGIAFDGENFHLFIEDGNLIRHSLVDIQRNRCANCDIVMDIGTHTGDPDIVFFNNRWHMFMDVEINDEYQIGYASTTPSDFPYGWRFHSDTIFGPDDLSEAQRKERSYTGDPDVALEGETLYLFYENPVRVVYNELDELRITDGQETRIRIEVDNDGDDEPDAATIWHRLDGGKNFLQASDVLDAIEGRRFRVLIYMTTNEPEESPMMKSFALGVRGK
jgi:hypothetical protein